AMSRESSARSRTRPPALNPLAARHGSTGGNATRWTHFSAATVRRRSAPGSRRRTRRRSVARWRCSRSRRPRTRSCTKPTTGRTGSPSRGVASSALRSGLASVGLGQREHHRLHLPAVLVEIDEQPGLVEERRRLARRRGAGGATPAIDDRRSGEDAGVRLELERSHDVGAKARWAGESEIDRHPEHPGRRLVALVHPLRGVEPVDLLRRGTGGIAMAGPNDLLGALAGDDTAPVGGADGAGTDD